MSFNNLTKYLTPKRHFVYSILSIILDNGAYIKTNQIYNK